MKFFNADEKQVREHYEIEQFCRGKAKTMHKNDPDRYFTAKFNFSSLPLKKVTQYNKESTYIRTREYYIEKDDEDPLKLTEIEEVKQESIMY